MKIKVRLKKNIPLLKKSAMEFNCIVKLVRENKEPKYSLFDISVPEERITDIDKMIFFYRDLISKKK